jgi:hypothetical protein
VALAVGLEPVSFREGWLLLMTPAQLVGWLALGFTFALAFLRGGRPERLGAVLVAVAWILSPLVERRESWFEPQYGILLVDMATLLALALLAIRYERYWPICAASFQAIAVLTHLAFLINPQALYRAYLFGNFSIGFLLLGAIVGGVAIEGAKPPPHRPSAWLRGRAFRSWP